MGVRRHLVWIAVKIQLGFCVGSHSAFTELRKKQTWSVNANSSLSKEKTNLNHNSAITGRGI